MVCRLLGATVIFLAQFRNLVTLPVSLARRARHFGLLYLSAANRSNAEVKSEIVFAFRAKESVPAKNLPDVWSSIRTSHLRMT